MFNSRFLIVPLSLLLCGFADPGTGLAVDPPNTYVAIPLPSGVEATAKVLIGVFRRDADLRSAEPPFCILAMHERPDNVERTQTELNARMRDPGRIENIVETFGETYTVVADEPIELKGVFGHQLTMQEKDASGGLEDVLQVNSSFDTPAGRITFNCASKRTNLASDLVTFGLIRDSITLP